jgi:thiamine biosynthesis lipoprotein
MHRRDFLDPRHLARGAGHVLGALDELGGLHGLVPEPFTDEVALLRLARRAMATAFEVVVPFGTPDSVALGEAAFGLLDELEAQLTVYRDTSEVCRLNREAPYRDVGVEPRLFGLLQECARLTAETGGAFDVTAGALIKAWGFFRGPRRVPGDDEREAALTRVGMRHVVLDAGRQTVRYLRPGLEINLGSVGKGHALDRVAEALAAGWEIPAVLLHGGYSSVYGRGSPNGDPRGWPVVIRHPWDPGRRLAEVWLRDRALATSAATFQYLEYQGRRLGHVLDPRTGWPASGVASATAVAPTAARADALSTAFFVGGMEFARGYCEAHPGVGAVLLPEDEPAEPAVFGLGPDECSPPPRGRGPAAG